MNHELLRILATIASHQRDSGMNITDFWTAMQRLSANTAVLRAALVGSQYTTVVADLTKPQKPIEVLNDVPTSNA